MSITFPRELPDDIAFRVDRFEIERGIAGSRSKNRVVNASQVAPPFWVAELSTKPLRYTARMRMEAWLESLRGPLRKAIYRHQLSCFPAAHPGDGGVAVDPGNLVSVANGNELTVDSVDAGLVLSVGDLVGIEATHWALGIVTEVSGTGTERVIAIEPAPPVDVAVSGAVVRFVRPGIIVRLASVSVEETVTGLWTVRFTLQESR